MSSTHNVECRVIPVLYVRMFKMADKVDLSKADIVSLRDDQLTSFINANPYGIINKINPGDKVPITPEYTRVLVDTCELLVNTIKRIMAKYNVKKFDKLFTENINVMEFIEHLIKLTWYPFTVRICNVSIIAQYVVHYLQKKLNTKYIYFVPCMDKIIITEGQCSSNTPSCYTTGRGVLLTRIQNTPVICFMPTVSAEDNSIDESIIDSITIDKITSTEFEEQMETLNKNYPSPFNKLQQEISYNDFLQIKADECGSQIIRGGYGHHIILIAVIIAFVLIVIALVYFVFELNYDSIIIIK